MKLLGILAFFFVSSISSGITELVDKQYYVLRNGDGTYLHVQTEAKSCLELAQVGTSPTVNTSDVTYLWKYIANEEGDHLLVDQERLVTIYKYNSVSLTASMWFCDNSRRHYTMTPIANTSSTYWIETRTPDHCLTSKGAGNQVIANPCDPAVIAQKWDFLAV